MPVNTKHSKPPRARVRLDPQEQDALKIAASGPAITLAPPERSQRHTKVYATICILLAAVTFTVYFRALSNPFVNYDDQGYVVENLQVQQGLTLATLRWALTSTDATNWHPLTWLSHAADCQIFRLNPKGHHLTSVLLHLCNVVLLFLLLARVTGSTFKSLLVAALFALHPINVESVAWIAERKTVLCMFFVLLTFGAYGWYTRRPRVGALPRRRWSIHPGAGRKAYGSDASFCPASVGFLAARKGGIVENSIGGIPSAPPATWKTSLGEAPASALVGRQQCGDAVRAKSRGRNQ